MLDFLTLKEKANHRRVEIVTAPHHAGFRWEMSRLVHQNNALVLKEYVFFRKLKFNIVRLFFKEELFFVDESLNLASGAQLECR